MVGISEWQIEGRHDFCMVCGKKHNRKSKKTCSPECGKKFSSSKYRWSRYGKRNNRSIGIDRMLDREFPESDPAEF